MVGIAVALARCAILHIEAGSSSAYTECGILAKVYFLCYVATLLGLACSGQVLA